MLSDSLISQQRSPVRMIELAVDPSADEHSVGASVQERLRIPSSRLHLTSSLWRES